MLEESYWVMEGNFSARQKANILSDKLLDRNLPQYIKEKALL